MSGAWVGGVWGCEWCVGEVGGCEWCVGGVWGCEWCMGGCQVALYQYAHNLCCPVRCSLLGQVECLTACFDSILIVLHLQLAVEKGTEGGREEWEGR